MPPSHGPPFSTGDGLMLHLNATGNAFSNIDSDLMAPKSSWAHHSLHSCLYKNQKKSDQPTLCAAEGLYFSIVKMKHLEQFFIPF